MTEIKLITTTEIEVKSIYKVIQTKNSAGFKWVSCRILKHCAHIVSKPISHICNASLRSGIYPDRLKFEVVKPIY